ncbi:MAG TPA: hypothetical protein VF735_18995 [Pyrinomonadaceae bacterium]|jgi:hypothetical protein
MITLQNKILPVALVAALLGGGVGAFVTRSGNPSTASTTATQPSSLATTETATTPATTEQAKLNTTTAAGEDQDAFRDGFAEGYRAAADRSGTAAVRRSVAATPVVYRTTSGRRARSSSASNSRRVYYDYNTEPRKRSFWQKHRDKLTVAMGTGGGAILGGLIGGKKGAAIGALAGAGGSALYTYKIRNRSRRY